MKTTIASLKVGLAAIAVVFAFAALPFVSMATTTSISLPGIDTPALTFPGLTTTSLTLTKVQCTLNVSSSEIATGGEVTVSWQTQGLDEIKINGVVVSGDSGSYTITSLSDSTNFQLVGTNHKGGACHASAYVKCIPPVTKECELDLHKSVDKTTANVGDTLTYTINIENVGDADCTGGGVKIEDKIDNNLVFVSQSSTGNITPGYNSQVYTASDRTLRWNGATLNPGEKGTITWTATVINPSSCGDFEIPNQAKATAKELNNFQTWAYSNVVKTAVDNNCVVKVCEPGDQYYNPGQDLTGSIYAEGKGRVANSSDYCDYLVGLASYEKFDEIIDNQKIFDWDTAVIKANGSAELMVDVPNCAYQIDLFYGEVLQSLDGQRYGDRKLDYAHLNSDKGYCGEVEIAPKCDFFTANPGQIKVGESTTLTWETTNAVQTFINNGVGPVAVDGSVTVSPLQDTTYVLTVIGDKDKVVDCHVSVHVNDTPERPVCPFDPAPNRTIFNFDERLRSDQSLGNSQTKIKAATLEAGKYDIYLASWDGYPSRVNVTQPNESWKLQFLSAGTEVGLSNAISDVPDKVIQAFVQEKVNSKYTLAADADGVRGVHAVYIDKSSANSVNPICAAVDLVEDPEPSCDLFAASPSVIVVGGSTDLTWETTNATRVVINNGIGEVAVDGTLSVSPLVDTTYQMTVFGTDDKSVNCEVPIKVTEEEIPVCKLFTATPGNLPLGGGDVNLNWEVEKASTVSISPTVGSVALIGSTTVNVTENTTYVLTAIDSNGDEVTCIAPVTVPDTAPFTCENNVSFNASPNSITRGSKATLNWDVTDADSVSISVINKTTFSGSETVSPSDDTTYILTATKGSESVECPATVTVSTGGGGGGSSSPRCELDISDERISLGEEITLTWDTSRANDVTLTDDLGNVIFSTDDMLSSEKDDYLEGSITLSPTRDTKYTLVAERGSRDRTCRVAVDLENDIVVLQTRDQQPLVAGISLTSVPYTGFEAGALMTFLFYTLLIAWAFYITYLIVARKRALEMAGAGSETITQMKQAETVRPDVFVQSVVTPVIPTNLPTSNSTPTVGYENAELREVQAHQATDIVVTDIENRAHAQKALLSSDAVRHFIATTEGSVERNEALDEVISEAKKSYPLEDGWIVINESRMQNLCEVCTVNASKPTFVTEAPATVPEGTGSLAESIVTGNVVAAYEMIGSRPMFALADAAADLDAVYRNRKGESNSVSAMLTDESSKLSDEQIRKVIKALTSALDGTYTDEASAVKMAIMKAVKEVA